MPGISVMRICYSMLSRYSYELEILRVTAPTDYHCGTERRKAKAVQDIGFAEMPSQQITTIARASAISIRLNVVLN